MKSPRPTTVDFETTAIKYRPFYPPIPVGVSIKKWGKKPRYYAWGHSCENNSTWEEAQAALKEAFAHPDGVLFQNAKFDIDVAEVWMKIKSPPWERIHDTLYLLFLDDPHQMELGLKPSAARLLDMPPEERDAVEDWLVKNQPIPGIKIGRGRNSKHPAGAYIAFAPGTLVGAYANGDVDRTEAIFRLLWQKNYDRAMSGAYDRERRLMACLLDMERQGVRVDLPRLRRDVASYQGWLAKIDVWLKKRLGREGDDDFNLDSGAQLVEAMVAAGVADLAKLGITAGGSVQTNKAAIAAGVTDAMIAAVLQYRAQLRTCVNTFLVTWLGMAEASGGFIFTTWNQVKGDKGTRTGRLSSTPNFQNIPKEFQPLFQAAKSGGHLPKSPWPDLPPLPLCRSYVIPYTDNDELADRDYSQQEPRILAHFEGGELLRQYQRNPWIDYHDNARDHLERIFKKKFDRKPVKNINLGIIYGQGVGSLAERNGQTVEETKELRNAIYALYPGLKDMYRDMTIRAKSKEPIRTWGGREYYCEPPKIINGRIMHFDYKMVNVLIQGSAADCTKEAIIRFYAARKSPLWRVLLQVHDELLLSVPKKDLVAAMECLRQCMESVEFEVQILSEGAVSKDNWSELRDYDKKGVRLDMAKAA